MCNSGKQFKSVRGMDDIVRRKIKKEVAGERMVDLFRSLLFQSWAFPPPRGGPKEDPRRFLLILHLVYPEVESLNVMILQELCTVCAHLLMLL